MEAEHTGRRGARPPDDGAVPAAPVAHGLSQVLDGLRQLAALAERAAGWDPGTRDRALADLELARGLLATVSGRLLVAERAAGTLRRPGDASFEAARARTSRAGLAVATREVRQADALDSLPLVADAVATGDVPLAHLDAVARTVATAGPRVSSALTAPEGQETVLALARSHDAPAFARALDAWAAAHDPDAFETDHQAQRRERFLTLSDQPHGTFLRGRLDRMTGHRLRLALEAAGEVPGADRTPQQASADALASIAERALSAPETASATSNRPHVSLLVSAETVADVRRRLGGTGDTALAATVAVASASDLADAVAPADAVGFEDAVADVEVPIRHPRTPVAPATLEDGTPVPDSELARVLCDCDLTRIVLTAESVPLDLGRTKRLYDGPHRRAVVARDRHCAWPGCAKPARWCEVHHMRWWDRDGGATSIANAVLLCLFHHQEVHRQDLTVQRHTSAPGRGMSDARGEASRRRSDEGVDALAGRPPGRQRPRYTFRRRRDGRVVAPVTVPGAAEPP